MSGASSAESFAKHPVNYPGNGRIASEPMLVNVRHDVHSRIQSMTSLRPVRVHGMSAQHSAVRSAEHPPNLQCIVRAFVWKHLRSVRAVAGKHPTQHRQMSSQRLAQQPRGVMAIAAEVRVAVRLTDTQHPANRPRNFQRGGTKWQEHGLAKSGQLAGALSSPRL